MRYLWCGLAALLLLGGMASGAAANSPWALIQVKDGIATYKQSLEGTDVCRFKGIGFVEAPMAVIGAVLTDVKAYPEWVPQCLHVKELRSRDRHNKVLYFQLDSPFPYKKRDMVVANRSRYRLDKGYVEISFHLTDAVTVPLRDKFVRLPHMQGFYRFEYYGPGRTRMIYGYQVDPGGNVPVSLANELEIKKYPYMNIQGMRQMAAQDKYRRAGLASPDHLRIQTLVATEKGRAGMVKGHVGRCIIDPDLVDLLYAESRRVEWPGQRVTEGDWSRIQQQMIGMMAALVSSPAVGAYIADKEWAGFFSVTQARYHRWLWEVLRREEAVPRAFLENQNGLLSKALRSPAVVQAWVADENDAEAILAAPSAAGVIAADQALQTSILELLADGEDLDEVGRMVAEKIIETTG